jgi:hypothetical protein
MEKNGIFRHRCFPPQKKEEDVLIVKIREALQNIEGDVGLTGFYFAEVGRADSQSARSFLQGEAGVFPEGPPFSGEELFTALGTHPAFVMVRPLIPQFREQYSF